MRRLLHYLPVHLYLTLGLQETHADKALIVILVQVPLPVEDQVVQVDPVAADGEVVNSRERLEVLHAVPAEDHVADVLSDVISQVLLFSNRTPVGSPRLAQERLVRSQVASSLVSVA